MLDKHFNPGQKSHPWHVHMYTCVGILWRVISSHSHTLLGTGIFVHLLVLTFSPSYGDILRLFEASASRR